MFEMNRARACYLCNIPQAREEPRQDEQSSCHPQREVQGRELELQMLNPQSRYQFGLHDRQLLEPSPSCSRLTALTEDHQHNITERKSPLARQEAAKPDPNASIINISLSHFLLGIFVSQWCFIQESWKCLIPVGHFLCFSGPIIDPERIVWPLRDICKSSRLNEGLHSFDT